MMRNESAQIRAVGHVVTLWLLLGSAAGRAVAGLPAADFEIRKPTAVEIDAAGQIVWQPTGPVYPVALKGGPDGQRLVADRNGNVVTVFSADGSIARTIRVQTPTDAEFLPAGHLLVTSAATPGAVQEFDAEGRVVWEYTALQRPRDATRLPNGHTVIADSGAPRVIEVTPAGEIVWSFSTALKLPSAVEPFGDDEILIADYNAHFVACVGRDGAFRWRMNHVGHPTALSVLADQTIVVAAEQAGILLQFDRHRRVLGEWRVGRRLDGFSFTAGGTLLLAVSPATPAATAEVASPALAAEVVRRYAAAAAPHATSEPGIGRRARAAALVVAALIAAGAFLWAPRRRWAYPAVVPVCLLLWFVLRPDARPSQFDLVTVDKDPAGNNLVLILVDSLRKDHVPWYGYWRNTTPRLLEFSKHALVFDQYVTQAPWTKPSVASLLTSTYPSNHGAVTQKQDSHLPLSLVTLAEVLRDAGYYTAAVMVNPHMGDKNSSKGFEQGFETYQYISAAAAAAELPGLVPDRAIEILDQRPKHRPFFLMLFFMSPHYPYQPKKLYFGGKEAGPSNPGPINDYDGEIYDIDRAVGRLLDGVKARDLMKHTVVAFSTDHGEEFGDHGYHHHGNTLYDCVLNVPLLIAGLGTVGRYPGLVREIDLMPTLLDYLEVAPTDDCRRQMAGVSVRPFIDGGDPRTGLVAYSETRFTEEIDAVAERSETAKVIVDFKRNTAERYDLERDPQEYNNLIAAPQAAAEIARIRDWVAGQWHADQPPAPAEPAPVPPEVVEQMRALGYHDVD